MAVQAQSPSNVFLLNRNGEERKSMLGGDYYLQAQTNGFLDQSTMFFNNGGAPNNPRKRGRETSVPSVTPINLLPLQSVAPSQKLVNVSQLQNQAPRVVSTGLRLSLEDQKQQQMGLLFSSSQGIAAQIQLQSDEIDHFIQSQGGQLRRMLAERTQRHYRALLCAAEEAASRRLRQKLAEVEKAARRNAELEESAARLSEEARGWQARASAQEAAAAALQAQLRQAITSGVGAAQDKWEELGCAVSGGENEMPVEDEGSAYVDPDRVVPVGPFCKECRKNPVSVVLLPCRHLCLCSECDSVVRICPICRSARSSSVEVFFK